MSEPVAWMWQHEETGMTGFIEACDEETRKRWEHMNRPRKIVVPLYASSYAMGVADAARVCNKWIEFFGDSPELHPLHVREKETAQDIQNAIRALTSPPSVTEEWVIQRVDDTFGRDSAFRAESAVRATLAALGIKVTK